jgi:Filamin/ABP280 repeat.
MAACKLKWKYLLFCAAEIKMPSGNIDKPIIEDNRDGTVSVKYEPREEGLHELSVKYNGEHVQGELEVSKLVMLPFCDLGQFVLCLTVSFSITM